jgi:hypothetical protein
MDEANIHNKNQLGIDESVLNSSQSGTINDSQQFLNFEKLSTILDLLGDTKKFRVDLENSFPHGIKISAKNNDGRKIAVKYAAVADLFRRCRYFADSFPYLFDENRNVNVRNPGDDIYSVVICFKEDANISEITKKVNQFICNNKNNPKKPLFASLCAEELWGNPYNSRKHTVVAVRNPFPDKSYYNMFGEVFQVVEKDRTHYVVFKTTNELLPLMEQFQIRKKMVHSGWFQINPDDPKEAPFFKFIKRADNLQTDLKRLVDELELNLSPSKTKPTPYFQKKQALQVAPVMGNSGEKGKNEDPNKQVFIAEPNSSLNEKQEVSEVPIIPEKEKPKEKMSKHKVESHNSTNQEYSELSEVSLDSEELHSNSAFSSSINVSREEELRSSISKHLDISGTDDSPVMQRQLEFLVKHHLKKEEKLKQPPTKQPQQTKSQETKQPSQEKQQFAFSTEGIPLKPHPPLPTEKELDEIVDKVIKVHFSSDLGDKLNKAQEAFKSAFATTIGYEIEYNKCDNYLDVHVCEDYRVVLEIVAKFQQYKHKTKEWIPTHFQLLN